MSKEIFDAISKDPNVDPQFKKVVGSNPDKIRKKHEGYTVRENPVGFIYVECNDCDFRTYQLLYFEEKKCPRCGRPFKMVKGGQWK